ncbi:YcjF family protein [Ensifer soli]|uniref:YcjF family protein n=1 Tax=Ciceribacter sp. sgz301302 TaxID=3342379 RepID=UPI0035BB1C9C
MTDTIPPRRPAAFAIDPDPVPEVPPAAPRRPAHFDEGIVMTPETEDPFGDPVSPETIAEALPRRRRLSLGAIAAAAFGVLVSLAVGVWVDAFIRDLFTRADWLGYTAIGVTAVLVLSLVALIGREALGIMRLGAVQALKRDVAEAAAGSAAAPARAVTRRLLELVSARPQTARGRERLKESDDDIIDGPQLIDLAERELMAPLDRDARALVLSAARRVSIVTAVSPRALVDLGYVLYESTRLIRAVADLYGGRPGTLGMIRLVRDVVAHLAVTGSIAVGDSLIQQVLGHGLASRLSARLGEGVLNGLMTARIGIAAIDLCRPMPFRAIRRPGIGDFLSDLAPSARSGDSAT